MQYKKGIFQLVKILMSNVDTIILSKIIFFLNSINYPDSLRIGKEIIEYTKGDEKRINNVKKRLSNNEPWEYIRGWSEFCGLDILVNRNVLIPRVETEQIIKIASSFDKKFKQIIDIGCGSGAISIALKKIFKDVEIFGVDIDKKALNLVKKNAKNNSVNIKYIQSNLLAKIKIATPTLIVANLPYIPSSEIKKLQPSVRDFEPKIALDGGKNGLEFIIKLLDQVRDNKNVIGVVLEMDPSQKEELKNYTTGFAHQFIKDSFGLFRFLKLYR